MRRSAAPSMRPVLPGGSGPVPRPPAATPVPAPPPSSATAAASAVAPPPPATEALQLCFAVVWSKNANRKHIKWDGDGLLLVQGRTCVLKDPSGKDIGRSTNYSTQELATLKAGETLSLGAKFVEIQNAVPYKDYASGTFFLGDDRAAAAATTSPAASNSGRTVLSTPFKSPMTAAALAANGADRKPAVRLPRHDPGAPGAVVLPRPDAELLKRFGSTPEQVVDVVVDPYLASVLRPHQREGVRFLYECVMGMKSIAGQGAILADEMGLGKTLQVIALIWTLLKQNPYRDGGMIKSALVVCPASLVQNWHREFKKWLGDERIRTYAAIPSASLHEFMATTIYPVLIIGYERFRQDWEVLDKAGFGLVVCDEGHRIKNAYIKTAQSLQSIATRRRIILSGTPIQNDLGEFFAMVDFVNPGLLKDYPTFRKVFEEPIVASRQSSSTPAEVAIGQARSAELARLTRECVLRRTSDINNKYLPSKTEYVLFCRPTSLQTELYQTLLGSKFLRSFLTSSSDGMSGRQPAALFAILLLRQLTNAPAALAPTLQRSSTAAAAAAAAAAADEDAEDAWGGIMLDDKDFAARLLARVRDVDPWDSGKLATVRSMLSTIAKHYGERVVVVSNFTGTLDLIQRLCETDGHVFVRLDGSTPTEKRQALVDRFNLPASNVGVFLLSAKSGGVGLNLIGASRIILVDPDWNPATDTQALARIWRDGQTRPVTTYRLLTSGTIDEKIYQRQLSKKALSDVVMDESEIRPSSFSKEELMDVFTLHDTPCNTHAILECPCQVSLSPMNAYHGPKKITPDLMGENGAIITVQDTVDDAGENSHKRKIATSTPHRKQSAFSQQRKKMLASADLDSWTHLGTTPIDAEVPDEAVKRVFQAGTVVFAFRRVLNKPGQDEEKENGGV